MLIPLHVLFYLYEVHGSTDSLYIAMCNAEKGSKHSNDL